MDSRTVKELLKLKDRVAALELVENLYRLDHVKASTDAGQNIPNNNYHTVIYEDELYDTNNEYVAATGVFTAKRVGYLHVTAALLMSGTTGWAEVESLVLAIYVNGAVQHRSYTTGMPPTFNIFANAQIDSTVLLALGDTVTIRVRQNSGAALTVYNQAIYNYVCFDWLP